MAHVVITDPGDARVADYRRLNDAGHRRRIEAGGPFGGGFLIAEGWLAVERAVRAHLAVRSVLVLDSKVERADELLGRVDVPVFIVGPEVCREIVGFELHRGVVAAAARRRPADPDVLVARSSRLLVIDGVNDGENIGALFRGAAALGADGVLVDPTSADPLSRRAVRGSVGHSLALPWARGSLAGRLGDHTVVALTPAPAAHDLRTVDVGDGPVAVLVGAEGPGLDAESRGLADIEVRIPMARGVDSLNVATAASIAMWHLFRQT